MPDNSLCPIFIFFSDVMEPTVEGILPVKEFLWHENVFKDFRLPILLGNEPENELEEKSKPDNEVR